MKLIVIPFIVFFLLLNFASFCALRSLWNYSTELKLKIASNTLQIIETNWNFLFQTVQTGTGLFVLVKCICGYALIISYFFYWYDCYMLFYYYLLLKRQFCVIWHEKTTFFFLIYSKVFNVINEHRLMVILYLTSKLSWAQREIWFLLNFWRMWTELYTDSITQIKTTKKTAFVYIRIDDQNPWSNFYFTENKY